MPREMDMSAVHSFGTGLSQRGVRNHNERLLLSLVQRNRELPASELARLSGLSPPTVSAILRRLEGEALLLRGDPVRGRVGKPSVPMRLNPDGVFAFGLKLGRRSADLALVDFTGTIRARCRDTYDQPDPDRVFAFLADGMQTIRAGLTSADAARICGLGIGVPFEIWKWPDDEQTTTLRREHTVWRDVSFPERVGAITDLPLTMMNDATAACQAEHVYGVGRAYRDYAYFFLGNFIGGGIVLNHSVYEGRQGNAGALGSLRSVGPRGAAQQLIETASIALLERRLAEVDIDTRVLWAEPQDWTPYARYVEPWLRQVAQELARASLSICAVIDFEAVVIDGAVPAAVRADLVERVRRYLATQDVRGLIPPQVAEGSIGGEARAIGAACTPILSQYLLNTHAGLTAA